MDTIHR